MCYICNCFAWTLDLIQRILTFFLTCWLTVAICSGFLIAIMAGMAYGYNYSIVEFLTLNKTDNVGVHMRRGHYYDTPDVLYPETQVHDKDYQQEISSNNSSILPNKLQKSDETEMMNIEKLIKYSETESSVDYEQVDLPQRTFKGLATPQHVIMNTSPPTLRRSTLIEQKAASNVMMKMFEPVRTNEGTRLKFDFTVTKTYSEEDMEGIKYTGEYNAGENKALEKIITADNFRKKIFTPDIRIVFHDFTKSTRIKMRHFWPTTPPTIRKTEPMSTKQILLKTI